MNSNNYLAFIRDRPSIVEIHSTISYNHMNSLCGAIQGRPMQKICLVFSGDEGYPENGRVLQPLSILQVTTLKMDITIYEKSQTLALLLHLADFSNVENLVLTIDDMPRALNERNEDTAFENRMTEAIEEWGEKAKKLKCVKLDGLFMPLNSILGIFFVVF